MAGQFYDLPAVVTHLRALMDDRFVIDSAEIAVHV